LGSAIREAPGGWDVAKRVAIAISLLLAYVFISSVLHFVVFPEPKPDASDLPRSGTVVENPAIRSKFVYRETFIETAGRTFEWDNFVEPLGGPIDIPHVHPHNREVFQVVDGEIRFVIDGEEHVAGAGAELIAEAGSVHAFQNSSDRPAYMISRFEAAEDGPWDDLARHGLLLDSQFVQVGRVGGMGGASPVQMIVFSGRFKGVGYLAGPPIWVQKATAFLIAPTARLFGVHAYYPPREARS
jgi:mannose-6-phosphate isomerase-like protein (cupin superfamily)